MGSKSSRLAALTDEQVCKYAKILGVSIKEIREFEIQYRAFNVAEEGSLTKQSFVDWFKTYYAQKDNVNYEENENVFLEKLYDVLDIDKNNSLSFEEFLSGNIYLTNRDKRKSLDAIFQILDVNNNGFLETWELEKILSCTRPFLDGFTGMQDINGAREAEKLLNKLNIDKSSGMISREKFISVLFDDPEFAEFQKQFNLNEASVKPGDYYTEPGRVAPSLGDFLK